MRLGKPFYVLGTSIDGRVYVYTAFGVFQTVEAAADRCREKRATIFAQSDVYGDNGGTPYGLTDLTAVAQVVG